MNNPEPKYSILLPVYNGEKYLPTCVETIINQDFHNYELIISNDHSNDNTDAYLKTINHPNVKILHPASSLSMAEHWEWVLAHSIGEWIMFVGQDDGLQAYFFTLAERLTAYAAAKKIRTIQSERAYFTWPGCEAIYGDTSASYLAVDKIEVLSCKFQALLALLSFKDYFELPQMYTHSLFHRDIITETKEKQNGKLFVTHPQDANLAAISCSLENKFLKSGIPLGWVGSSPKSAGMAVNASSNAKNTNLNNTDLLLLKKEYLDKINKSELNCHPLIGDFAVNSFAVYFWGALLKTQHLRKRWITRLLLSKLIKYLLFSATFSRMNSQKNQLEGNRMDMYYELLRINKCSPFVTVVLSNAFTLLYLIYRLFYHLNRRIQITLKTSFRYSTHWKENLNYNMINLSDIIKKGLFEKKILER